MPQRDRKKRKRDRHTKDSKSRRTSKSALTCKFCNLAVTNVRGLAVHFRQCLHAQSRERYMVAASDGSDTATEDSAMCDSGTESDNLSRGATWDFSSCCDGSTTHCEPSFLAQTGTEPHVFSSRVGLLSLHVSLSSRNILCIRQGLRPLLRWLRDPIYLNTWGDYTRLMME